MAEHSHGVDAAAWATHARSELQRAGHRAGGARAEVVELLGEQRCCLSANQIHDELRGRRRRVGLASVYRALDVLTQLKLVHRLDVSGIACYEPADPSGEHHHHAICDECGQMAPFEDPALEALIESVGQRLGYAVGTHDVVLRGACPDCADSGPRRAAAVPKPPAADAATGGPHAGSGVAPEVASGAGSASTQK